MKKLIVRITGETASGKTVLGRLMANLLTEGFNYKMSVDGVPAESVDVPLLHEIETETREVEVYTQECIDELQMLSEILCMISEIPAIEEDEDAEEAVLDLYKFVADKINSLRKA